MRTVSLSPLTVLPGSPIDQIDAALDAGFDSVGLRLFPSLPTDIDVMADASLLRAIERRLGQTGVRVLDIEVVRVSPHLDVAALADALAFAEGVGARWLATTSEAIVDYRPDDERDLVARLRELSVAAGERGLGVMLEFMAFRGIRHLEDAVRIVESVDVASVGITVDALHLFRSGGSVESVKAVNPSRFACLQICDGPRQPPESLTAEARGDRHFAGEGEFPLVDLVRALPADLPVSVEVPSRAHVDLPAAERARIAAETTRDLLDSAADRAAVSQEST
jgi:sugar phosphate isomerase/epimerase